MALLGTFIDRSAGISVTAAGYSTLAHSLGTAPDAVLLQLRSQSVASVSPIIADGGNASMATVGQVGATTSFFAAYVIYFQSITR